MLRLTPRLSPIQQRRLANFKANRRGYWSLWIFLALFILSLFGELIANDKPLYLHYQGQHYFPVLVDYPGTDFGGFLPTPADYRDPFIRDEINHKGVAIWPLIPFYYDTINYDLPTPAPAPPSAMNWLGTDDRGRDVVARIIYGFRLSVLFSLALTLATVLVGVLVGALQGFYGGKVDLFGQRFIEIWQGLPVLYLLIILSSLIEPDFWILLGVIALFSWMGLVDLVRAEFLRARNLEYVRAARALGLNNRTIMFRHMLPNAMVATLTFTPFILAGGVTQLSALDFLGFGMPIGSPSLGELIAQGKSNLQAPWLGFSAFFTLAVMLSLMVFVGEAVRDAFDPRKN